MFAWCGGWSCRRWSRSLRACRRQLVRGLWPRALARRGGRRATRWPLGPSACLAQLRKSKSSTWSAILPWSSKRKLGLDVVDDRAAGREGVAGDPVGGAGLLLRLVLAQLDLRDPWRGRSASATWRRCPRPRGRRRRGRGSGRRARNRRSSRRRCTRRRRCRSARSSRGWPRRSPVHPTPSRADAVAFAPLVPIRSEVRTRSARQLAADHVAEDVDHLLGRARGRLGGAVDLLQRVVELGVVKGDRSGLPRAAAYPASKAAFHCRYLSPKRTTTTSAARISVWVRIALTPAPLWSRQKGSLSSPSVPAPASSEAAWSVTGAEKATGSPASRDPGLDPLAPVGMDLPGEIDAPGALAHARILDAALASNSHFGPNRDQKCERPRGGPR